MARNETDDGVRLGQFVGSYCDLKVADPGSDAAWREQRAEAGCATLEETTEEDAALDVDHCHDLISAPSITKGNQVATPSVIGQREKAGDTKMPAPFIFLRTRLARADHLILGYIAVLVLVALVARFGLLPEWVVSYLRQPYW